MMGRASSVLQSRRTRGILWLVAAMPMLIVPMLRDGSMLSLGIGMMFLVFGLATLRGQR